MSKAFVFPGQGAQSAGMGRSLADVSAECRAVFDEADEALGEPLSRLIFEGPQEQLDLTANTQPAVLTVSVAAWKALGRNTIRPSHVAGHSLGEYSALVAAGALAFPDAVRLVRARGRYMQEATPVGTGAMAAIMGLDLAQISRACEEAGRGEVVTPANLNSPEQTVISGHAAAVERAAKLCSERGARRVVPLPVSAPFHCALMKPAQDRLAGDIARTRFSDALVPVITNVDARPARGADEIRDALVRQVTAPVRWVDCAKALVAGGVDTIVELGPGRTLSGFMRRIDRSIGATAVEDSDTLARTRQLLEKD